MVTKMGVINHTHWIEKMRTDLKNPTDDTVWGEMDWFNEGVLYNWWASGFLRCTLLLSRE
jgi:hypothetical protein